VGCKERPEVLWGYSKRIRTWSQLSDTSRCPGHSGVFPAGTTAANGGQRRTLFIPQAFCLIHFYVCGWENVVGTWWGNNAVELFIRTILYYANRICIRNNISFFDSGERRSHAGWRSYHGRADRLVIKKSYNQCLLYIICIERHLQN
jgi:hypothetical protein